MNAEGFAFWCAEAKQIFRQSYFADGFAIETCSFKETFCKIDEPQCPQSFTIAWEKKKSPRSLPKQKYLICTEKEDLLPKTLVSQSLQAGSSGSISTVFLI